MNDIRSYTLQSKRLSRVNRKSLFTGFGLKPNHEFLRRTSSAAILWHRQKSFMHR